MVRPFLYAVLIAVLINTQLISADPVFSGPQTGEKLPALNLKGVFGDHAGQEFDFLASAGDRPVLIIFIHERTRPAFGLMKAVMDYARTRQDDGLRNASVFLTGDATATEKWMNVVQSYFPKGIEVAISPDGQEGPGTYGLNRNVALTVLVGKEGKVHSNFALVQPSVQADGPKILKSIVEVLGGGEVPDIATLAGERYAGETERGMAKRDDPQMRPLLGAVINKNATPEQVAAAAKKVEEYVTKNPDAAKELGRISQTVVNSDRFGNYGTEEARKYLKSWAEKYGYPNTRPGKDRQNSSDKPRSNNQNE